MGPSPSVARAASGWCSTDSRASATSDWVLILDADERVPPELANELCRLATLDDPRVGAYRVARRLYMWGRWLRHSSLYPTWVVRFVHRRKVRYVNRGHAETERVSGETRELRAALIDENFKGLDAWFERQIRYAMKDAEYEMECEGAPLDLRGLLCGEPMRRRAVLTRLAAALPLRGMLYCLYCYVFRMGFLDGRDGLAFCRMKALYQSMIVARKHEFRKSEEHRRASKADTTT